MKTQFVGTMTNYIQTNRGMGKKNDKPEFIEQKVPAENLSS